MPPKRKDEAPCDIPAERCLLGSLLLEPSDWHDAHKILRSPEAFHHRAHQIVYDAMMQIVDADLKLDIATVCTQVDKMGLTEECGGWSYIADLTTKPGLNSACHFAETVHDCHVLRELLKSIDRTHDAITKKADPKHLIPVLQDELTNLDVYNRAIEDTDLITGYREWFKKRSEKKQVGLRTGIYELDRQLHLGLQDDMLMVIGARPSDGKTSLMMSINHNLLAEGHHTLIVNLEGDKNRLLYRLHNQACPTDLFMKHEINRNWAELNHLRESYFDKHEELVKRLTIIDTERTIENVAYAIKSHLARNPKCASISIDYLQLVDTRERYKTDTERVNIVLRKIGALRRDVRRPFIVLSQLNREDQGKPNPLGPELHHMKQSGDIEQDADIAILLWNPNSQHEPDTMIKAKIAKQRDGPKGVVELRFVKPQYLLCSPTQPRNQYPKQEGLANVTPFPKSPQYQSLAIGEDECPF